MISIKNYVYWTIGYHSKAGTGKNPSTKWLINKNLDNWMWNWR